jgi:formiminoglutamase
LGCTVRWCHEVGGSLEAILFDLLERFDCQTYVTVDADVVRSADVPGVSAPNPVGLSAEEIKTCARLAGSCCKVSSFDLVEINLRHDRDGQSSRWAALTVWNFLVGLASRKAHASVAPQAP